MLLQIKALWNCSAYWRWLSCVRP